MSTENNTEQNAAPTAAEIMNFYHEQISIKSLQRDLQKINTEIATYKAEELKAYAFIGQMTTEPKNDMQEHVVTKEDLVNNPELSENGVEEGDTIQIPVERKLKKA
jgi:replicative DNA helicase